MPTKIALLSGEEIEVDEPIDQIKRKLHRAIKTFAATEKGGARLEIVPGAVAFLRATVSRAKGRAPKAGAARRGV
jgi:hypothetical protein